MRDSLASLLREGYGASAYNVGIEQWIIRPGEGGEDNTGKKGDIRVRGLDEREPTKEADIDVQVVYADSSSYRSKKLEQILSESTKAKLDKHKAPAEAQGRSFLPFIVTTDGCLSDDAENLLCRIADRLAEKWKKGKGLTMAWVRAKMSVAVAKATSACIRGLRSNGEVGQARGRQQAAGASYSSSRWGFEDGAALPVVLSSA